MEEVWTNLGSRLRGRRSSTSQRSRRSIGEASHEDFVGSVDDASGPGDLDDVLPHTDDSNKADSHKHDEQSNNDGNDVGVLNHIPISAVPAFAGF